MNLKIFIIFSILSYVYSYKIGIVGPTGAVGKEIINCLYSELGVKNSKLTDIKLFSSKRSAGKFIDTPFGKRKVELFDVKEARKCDVNFLAVSGDFSKKYAKALSYGHDGSIVIDNSSAFRYDDDVPLVIPEINGNKIKNKKLISNPNCTTAIALIALYPILLKYGIKKLIMSTYQASSGAGYKGMEELDLGIKDYVTKNTYPTYNHVFSHPLPFNVIPHIDEFLKDGETKEEWKMVVETKKILDPKIEVFATCVRVPVFIGHGESINIETEKPINFKTAVNILKKSRGIAVVDTRKDGGYISPDESAGEDDVFVSRIRKDKSVKNGLALWVAADNLRKGAALNSVQIAEELIKIL